MCPLCSAWSSLAAHYFQLRRAVQVLPACQDKLALCFFPRNVGMQPFLRGSNRTSRELSVNISEMQITLGCRDKHFDIPLHTVFLRDYCSCRPCPYITHCVVFPNKDPFLTCPVRHLTVLKFIAENAVSRVSWAGGRGAVAA